MEALPALVTEGSPGGNRLPPPSRANASRLRARLRGIVRRYRWTELAVFAAVVGTTLFVTLTAIPVYRATALVEIGAARLAAAPEAPGRGREHDRTPQELLRSRALARRVIERLDLAAEPAFNPPVAPPGPGAAAVAWLRTELARAVPALAPRAPGVAPPRLVDRFLAAVEVVPRDGSALVEVSFRSPSAPLAATVTNTIAEEYTAMAIERRLAAVQKGRMFLERQLDASRTALERAEEELAGLAGQTDVLAGAKRDTEYRRLADLKEALGRAELEKTGKEARYEAVRAADPARLAEVTDSPAVRGLAAELARREGERTRLLETLPAESWSMRHLRDQIVALRARLGGEQQALAAALRAEVEAAGRQQALLAQALEAQQKLVTDLGERAADYRILTREVDTSRTVYGSLLRRLRDVEVAAGLGTADVEVIDPAEVPVRPDRPRPLLNLGLALVGGALAGVGAALLRARLDHSLRTADDVERHLGLATLGAVPRLRARRARGRLVPPVPELVVAEAPRSIAAEALRTLRAALFLATPSGPPQCILVTSAHPEEGKTCVATNLALVLAQMGRRVVIVDCDLRRPRLHRLFGLELDTGATSFLIGHLDLPALIRPTPYGVDVLPSGPVPPNPVELIASARMMSLLDELSRRYDFVLLDAPPAIGFADVPLLASLAGGVLFVVRAGETSRMAAAQATDHLRRLRAQLLGVVLNDVRTNHPGDGPAYYAFYGDVRREAPGGSRTLTSAGLGPSPS